jgi:hypothetical protein
VKSTNYILYPIKKNKRINELSAQLVQIFIEDLSAINSGFKKEA